MAERWGGMRKPDHIWGNSERMATQTMIGQQVAGQSNFRENWFQRTALGWINPSLLLLAYFHLFLSLQMCIFRIYWTDTVSFERSSYLKRQSLIVFLTADYTFQNHTFALFEPLQTNPTPVSSAYLLSHRKATTRPKLPTCWDVQNPWAAFLSSL